MLTKEERKAKFEAVKAEQQEKIRIAREKQKDIQQEWSEAKEIRHGEREVAKIERETAKAVKGVEQGAKPAPTGDGQIVCPHCQTKGSVTTKKVKTKRGISGGKATGAVLTGGLSILATGLSRKTKGIEATCKNCKMSWIVG